MEPIEAATLTKPKPLAQDGVTAYLGAGPGSPPAPPHHPALGAALAALGYPSAGHASGHTRRAWDTPPFSASYPDANPAQARPAAPIGGGPAGSSSRSEAMREYQTQRPVRVGPNTFRGESAPPGTLNSALQRGVDLYQQFNGFGPTRTLKVRQSRVIPPVVVDLGDLVGLIYRSDKRQPGRFQAYVHLMQHPPRLVSNIEGSQLYIVGGNYRVTEQGIEG